MTEWIVGLALFIALLFSLAALADWWDARERREARRRNHARRIR